MSESMPVLELLKKATGEAVVMDAPGQASLSYGVLLDLVEKTVLTLNRNGIQRNDRVAIVLPNGPGDGGVFRSRLLWRYCRAA